MHGRKQNFTLGSSLFSAGRGLETSTQSIKTSLLTETTFPFPRDTSRQDVILNRAMLV